MVFSSYYTDMKLQFDMENLSPDGENFDLCFKGEEVSVDEIDGDVCSYIRITKKGHLYQVKGHLEYEYPLICSRCLTDFTREFKPEFDCELKKYTGYGVREKEMDPDNLLNGDKIDLSQLFHDLILLSIPMKPVCSEDCRGLCPVCGKNLNEGDCEHSRELKEKDIDPRWKKLLEVEVNDART